jgi:WD40 repeat protein
VWNVRTGECTHTLEGHSALVLCVAFDGTTIVSGSTDREMHIWRAPYNTAECERVIEVYLYVARVWLCTTPNEHIVVSVDRDRRVLVHDMRTGNQVCAPIELYSCKLSQ